MRDVKLLGSNLRYAKLMAADLSGAYLIGADLIGADLRGANLSRAVMYGANLEGANLAGAIMDEAKIWKTTLPGGYEFDVKLDKNITVSGVENVDLSRIEVRPPDKYDRKEFAKTIRELKGSQLAKQLKEELGGLFEARDAVKRNGDKNYKAWLALKKKHTVENWQMFRKKRTEFLAQLICEEHLGKAIIADHIIDSVIVHKYRRHFWG